LAYTDANRLLGSVGENFRFSNLFSLKRFNQSASFTALLFPAAVPLKDMLMADEEKAKKAMNKRENFMTTKIKAWGTRLVLSVALGKRVNNG